MYISVYMYIQSKQNKLKNYMYVTEFKNCIYYYYCIFSLSICCLASEYDYL